MNDADYLKILLRRFIDVPKDEEEDMCLSNEICRLSPDPKWSDYIFYSQEFVDGNGNIDIDRLVDKLMAFKPVSMPDWSKDKIS
ncbi:hypothetical protein [Sphingomonas sp. GM_Shp_1]|uniref:hypothetical protein n=1 Tax=Sphingomonas sp. GM_Shp_1 TaxID=2937381 RepID=UPI00226B722B|nr:hypothetical protein [Sphingomonas sp. GM_Shp_1]